MALGNLSITQGAIILFEQAFKNIDDTLRKDAGVSNELDYIEQTSWILFLKYLDDLEVGKQLEADDNDDLLLELLASARNLSERDKKRLIVQAKAISKM